MPLRHPGLMSALRISSPWPQPVLPSWPLFPSQAVYLAWINVNCKEDDIWYISVYLKKATCRFAAETVLNNCSSWKDCNLDAIIFGMKTCSMSIKGSMSTWKPSIHCSGLITINNCKQAMTTVTLLIAHVDLCYFWYVESTESPDIALGST